MIKLQEGAVRLRALEPDDLSLLLQWENDPQNWTVSQQRTLYSEFLMKQYLLEAGRDPWEVRQLRLIIMHEEQSIGLLDFFDFEPDNNRGAIGVLIGSKAERGKGIGSTALRLFINYLFPTFQLHQVYADISANNEASLRLFRQCGFKDSGVRKQWYRKGDQFEDAHCLQLLKADL